MRQLDEVDRTLMSALAADGRRTLRALARMVGLSEPAVRDRVLRLEREQVIAGYHAALDPEAADAGTAAFIAVRFDTHEEAKAQVDAALRADHRVLEVHEVAGEDCYWLKLRVASTAELAAALDRIRAIPAVRGTSTTIVLRTVFERPILPAAGATSGADVTSG